jgi:hypothetical protein
MQPTRAGARGLVAALPFPKYGEIELLKELTDKVSYNTKKIILLNDVHMSILTLILLCAARSIGITSTILSSSELST